MQSSSPKKPLRGKRNQDVDEDIISEIFIYRIKDWANLSERYGFEMSTECSLCDNDWLITFRGTDHHTDYASIYITNLSEKCITASYIITIRNKLGLEDIIFIDPEESVTFDADGGGDDTWGTDEFTLSANINDEKYGFIEDDCLEIEIEIQICGIIKISSTVLSKAIENATDVNDLLALADLDIDPFRTKYLVSTSDILISQENSLVSSRFSNPNTQRKRIGTSNSNRKR